MPSVRRAWALSLAAALSCSPVPAAKEPGSTEPREAIAWPSTHDADALVFPPPPTRRARRPLPRGFAAIEETPPEIDSPRLDADGHFEFAGRTLSIEFNRRVRPVEGSTPPPLRITPAVPGSTEWRSPWALDFVAEAPFDPERVYAVELGEVEDEQGRRVPAWSATFRADPQVVVAGKILSYVPQPGEPRVVAVVPHHGSRVGRAAQVEVLFDQPVKLHAAHDLVALHEAGAKTEVPIRLSHPSRDVFDGSPVDRRQVVRVRPRKRPRAGDELVLITRDFGESIDDADRTELAVAEPLRFEGIECGYTGGRCTFADGRLQLRGHNFTLVFNNPVATDRRTIVEALHFEPEVRNLSVWNDRYGSEGRVRISGSFAPSTRYAVELHGLQDTYGSRQRAPLELEVSTAPLPASVSMSEGIQLLDEARSRSFEVTTRNVAHATLKLWKIEDTRADWDRAQWGMGRREAPDDDPDLTIPIEPGGAPNTPATTKIDLLAHTEAGRTYRASLELDEPAHGASPPAYPAWSHAGRSPAALLTVTDTDALAVHARTSNEVTLVHVARLHGGEPLSGARFFVDGQRIDGVTSDALGFATLPTPADTARRSMLRVEVGSDRAELLLGRNARSHADLTPELSNGRDGPRSPIRAMVFSDRGAYRPGATMHFKGTLRHEVDGSLLPAAYLPVRLRVIAPTGKDVFVAPGMTDDMGSIAADYATPPTAEIGRYETVIEPLLDPHTLASTTTQVAEFEPPRFTVDVKAEAEATQLKARIEGRYLFGAAMDDAEASWSLRREAAPMPAGPFVAHGLKFRGRRSLSAWSRTGAGRLEDGALAIEQVLEMEAEGGPQRFTLEAEVTDASHRAIAGRDAVLVHPAAAYAGLRIEDTSIDVDEAMPVELGVIDHDGSPVAGRMVEVELVRLDWKRTRRPGPGGSVHVDWHETRRRVDRCRAESARTIVRCSVTPKRSGTYELVARVDGRRGGTIRAWAWGSGYAGGDPTTGHRLDVQMDRRRYAAGERAVLLARNPFAEATAIFTVEDGAVLHSETRRVKAGRVRFEVPIGDGFAPHVHATVTLLPIGAEGPAAADWRFGAVRVPVSLHEKRLDVAVASDRMRYEPGNPVEITVKVSQGGTPVEGAEVALAVVDEGVLRLTDFHAPDPVDALYRGSALRYSIADTRHDLAEMLERSHTAGDGAGSGEQSLVSTRKSFVHTVAWRPDLRTDAQGRATARVKLPDNLTTFRMMAVALDSEGRGGDDERAFEVQKPLMAVPAVPRFAALGDRFEAATLVHNNEEEARTVEVALEHGGRARKRTIEVPAHGSRRVAFEVEAREPGVLGLVFSVRDEERRERDRVEAKLPVQAPGIEERPRLSGAFGTAQDVVMEVPAGVYPDLRGEDDIVITLGQHMWPELGERVEYLVDYPHGCVEQTTSSTLPLLAAREILPRLGFTRFDRARIDTFIRAGLERLASMQTPGGGLAYWPGAHEPNVYGTAYAIQAVALATRDGLEAPPGLLDGMRTYLQEHLRAGSGGAEAEVLASIALGLSMSAQDGALPASSADMLYDTVEKQGVFGLANLALSLSTLEGQDDRVGALLDLIEASFGPQGELLRPDPDGHFHYYGSEQRTRAQAVLALSRLRPSWTRLPRLVEQLVHETGSYTTQATALGLVALREQVERAPRPDGAMRVLLDGRPLMPRIEESAELGGGALRYRIPMQQLAGRRAMLRMESTASTAVAFVVEGRWRRPLDDAEGLSQTSAERGPEVYRVFTDPRGEPVDLSTVQPGEVLRVALLARLPVGTIERSRLGYLAVTDRLPAGFEAVQPDLWTVSRAPDIEPAHPLYDLLRWGSADASHVELRDDRVHMYFDRVWDEYVAGTYLVRATTPGTFVIPPAMGELMYEPDSLGYGKHQSVTVTR